MKNKFWGTDILLVIITIACVIFGAALAVQNKNLAIAILLCVGIIAIIIFANIKSVRKLIRGIFFGTGKEVAMQQLSLDNLPVGVAIISKGSIVWYNKVFRENILHSNDCYLAPLNKIIPNFDIEKSNGVNGLNIKIDQQEYTVYSSSPNKDSNMWVSYFVNDTSLKVQAKEYNLTRPVIMQIVVDTYDEVLKELKESHRAQIMAKLDQLIEDMSNSCNGFSMKVGSSRYHIIIEDRYFDKIHDGQFEILANTRNIEEGSVTLSIGVGRTGKDFAENDMLARQALDMALGRGGDQAVVKSQEGYEFFGGTLPSVEKRSKVRSRIVARALKDIILQSENVLIMGHKMSDLDSIGSAVGLAAAIQSCDKKAYIVVDEENTLSTNLIQWVKEDTENADLFITPERAFHYLTPNTLLIVVDTHVARMTEVEELCRRCKKLVVVDHHRRMVDYINNTVVSYHEPYASSASELVTELIQYIMPAHEKLTQRQADALLAGIVLDTRNFSEKSGVRTFEAAAYLRRQGAQPTEVLKLFSVPKDIYTAKSRLVNNATIYKGVAVSLSEELSDDLSLAVPQAANDLLTLEGVDASVVAVKFAQQVNISARSLGEINVQVLMEYLGGGGHLTMAGAQLKETSLEQAKDKIKESIDNYKK